MACPPHPRHQFKIAMCLVLAFFALARLIISIPPVSANIIFSAVIASVVEICAWCSCIFVLDISFKRASRNTWVMRGWWLFMFLVGVERALHKLFEVRRLVYHLLLKDFIFMSLIFYKLANFCLFFCFPVVGTIIHLHRRPRLTYWRQMQWH